MHGYSYHLVFPRIMRLAACIALLATAAGAAGVRLRYEYAAECPYDLLNQIDGTMRISGGQESTWKMSFQRVLHVTASSINSGDKTEIQLATRSAKGTVTIDQRSFSEQPIRFEFDLSPSSMSGTLILPERRVPLDNEALLSLKGMLGIGTEVAVAISNRGIVSAFRSASSAPATFRKEDQEEIVRWVCGQVYPPLPPGQIEPGISWTSTPGKAKQEPQIHFERTVASHTFVSKKMIDLEKFIKKQIDEQQPSGQTFGQGSGITSPFFWPFDVRYTFSASPQGPDPGETSISLNAGLQNARIDLENGDQVIFANLAVKGSLKRHFGRAKLNDSHVEGTADFRRNAKDGEVFLSFEVKSDCCYLGSETKH